MQNIIFLRKAENIFEYKNDPEHDWEKFSSDAEIKTAIISHAKETDSSLLVIPENIDKIDPDYLFIFSEGTEFKTLSQNNILFTNEAIDNQGNISKPLTEEEINRLLHKIFEISPKYVIICLNNGLINSIHERILRNLLKTINYKIFTSSDLI